MILLFYKTCVVWGIDCTQLETCIHLLHPKQFKVILFNFITNYIQTYERNLRNVLNGGIQQDVNKIKATPKNW